MLLSDLIADLPDIRSVGGDDPDVTGISTDTRTLRPGDLFAAISGGGLEDRHQWVAAAETAGAAAVLVQRPTQVTRAAVVETASVRRTVAEVSNRFFDRPADDLRMVGVTGTNGKTTSAYLLHAILEAAGETPGLLTTVEQRIGNTSRVSSNTTPEAPDLYRLLKEMRDAGCRSAVMEVSSHALALDRTRGIGFEAAVFTNLSRDHLDFHETPEAYLSAKALLFENLDANAQAVVNGDDPLADRLIRDTKATVTRFGTGDDCDVRIVKGASDWQGSTLDLVTPAGHMSLAFSLRGRFNLMNAAGAVAVGLAMEIGPDALDEAIRDVKVPGRMEAVDVGQPFGVLVDYAHTPDALENVLKAARSLTKGKLICVFGAGGDRDPGKRPEMGRASAELADLSVVTSDNPRTEDPRMIIEQIVPGMERRMPIVEPDRYQAIQIALAAAGPNDLVVIAGKGHEPYQEIDSVRHPFDDRLVAAELLRGREK